MRGEVAIKIKDKIKEWLFSDELKDIQKLKNNYDCLKSVTQNSLVLLNDAKEKQKESYELLNECRKTMNSVCDIGTDIGFHSNDHSWAVICIHGKIDYVKFIPMKQKDIMEILRFLKRFEWSNRVTDSPFGFKEMIEDRIVRK